MVLGAPLGFVRISDMLAASAGPGSIKHALGRVSRLGYFYMEP